MAKTKTSRTTNKRTTALTASARQTKTLSTITGQMHRTVKLKSLRARFDTAQTTNDNSNHWSNADHLSADAALSPEIRRIVRNRSRYEVANNSYARGIIDTLANDTIGTGPRLQLLIPGSNSIQNNEIEQKFAEWMNAVNLAAKLRTMRKARAQDGEVFGIMTNNPKLQTSVKLDLKLFEADQITTPYTMLSNILNQQIDGIEFDQYGNPTKYYLLNKHPGNTHNFDMGHKEIDADSMIHWFKADRPGQSRGIPEIMPALPLFAQLRRYTLAVIAAAEAAANLAMVIFSKSPASGEPSQEIVAMDVVELERRMATVLPEGWELGQMEAVQPTSTYDSFVKTILREIARCMQMPFNIAGGDSSGYNYASGRLDGQTYYKNLDVDRSDLEIVCLDRLFAAWWNEAILVTGLIPIQWRNLKIVPHQWNWDGREHVDPSKESNARDIDLGNHSTNYSIVYGKQGRDWEVELRQSVKEIGLMVGMAKEFNVPLELVMKIASKKAVPIPAGSGKDDENDDGEIQNED